MQVCKQLFSLTIAVCLSSGKSQLRLSIYPQTLASATRRKNPVSSQATEKLTSPGSDSHSPEEVNWSGQKRLGSAATSWEVEVTSWHAGSFLDSAWLLLLLNNRIFCVLKSCSLKKEPRATGPTTRQAPKALGEMGNNQITDGPSPGPVQARSRPSKSELHFYHFPASQKRSQKPVSASCLSWATLHATRASLEQAKLPKPLPARPRCQRRGRWRARSTACSSLPLNSRPLQRVDSTCWNR